MRDISNTTIFRRLAMAPTQLGGRICCAPPPVMDGRAKVWTRPGIAEEI